MVINYKKILIAVLICLFTITSLSTMIFENNSIHLSHCHKQSCKICELINLANYFYELFEYSFYTILLLNCGIPLCKLVMNVLKRYKIKSLVDMKVIMQN